jgi:hypothetical protein
MIAIACMLAMLSASIQAQHSPAQAPAPRKKHASAHKKAPAKSETPVKAAPPIQPVQAQLAPPIPATLMNRAPVIPSVTMSNGLLTIDAPNSMLSEVLSGVRTATGAVIEGAAPDERVAVRLGPGNPRQVVAALLQGTPYDYVILGSQKNQDVVTRILLTHSSDSSSAQGGAGAGNQPKVASPQPPPMYHPPERSPTDEEAAQPAGEIPAEQTDQSVQLQQQLQQQQQTQQQLQQQQDPNQNQPKTPDQLFKEMQPADAPKPAQ